jgi:cephalosporin-C deacetylase-like acetyl esterase
MSYLRSILFVCLLLSGFLLHGQSKQYQVLPWKSEATVNTFLLQEVHRQYDLRRAAFQHALSSKQLLQAYRDSCKLRYQKLLGTFPSRTELNAVVKKSTAQDGYTVEQVVFESLPHHHVTSTLYVPSGKGPFPAVLLLCGHEAEAKATDSYQRTAILFAQHGFVVLVVDPISQGERYQLTGSDGKPLTRGGTTEHTLINAAANLAGTSAVAFELWDNVRALDYLATRKEVDPERIGCVGNSGGGTQVTYLIGFDDRIKIAAPCSYIASRERNLDLIGASDGCQHLPGEGKARLEMSDFLIMFAPKPLLILAGRYDFVEYTGTVMATGDAKQVYDLLHQPDRLKLFTADDGHGISKPKREAAVLWFRKWFYNDNTAVREGGIKTLSVSALQCTQSGQVNVGYRDELNDFQRVAEIVKKSAGKIAPLTARLNDVLDLADRQVTPEIEDAGTIDARGVRWQKFIVREKGTIPLPVLVTSPSDKPKKTILWLHDDGKQKIADSTSLLATYQEQGVTVVLADIAGIGELTDPASFNDAKYVNKEYRNAMIAQHTGSSLPALRIRNVLQLLDLIASNDKLNSVPVEVHATGCAAFAALHAAVLDERIASLVLQRCPSSFQEVVDDPTRKDWYSYVIPGAWLAYDLPELRSALGSRLKE